MRRFIVVAAVSLATVLTLSGCMWQFASGSGWLPPSTPFISGTVVGTPISGTYTAVITGSGPSADPNCNYLDLLVTLTDTAGNTVTKQETLQSCGGNPALYTGQYTVTGGTGIYQGATGSGTSSIQFTFSGRLGPFTFTAQQIGTFEVPGTASAASGRKTFKMRGTLKPAVTSKENR